METGTATAGRDSSELLSALREKVYSLKRPHLVVEEDNWYSCPASGECIRDHDGRCDCGAQEHNQGLLECLEIIDRLIADNAKVRWPEAELSPEVPSRLPG